MSEEFQPTEEPGNPEYHMDEKVDEKVEEKEMEKVEEKQMHEKGRRDPLGAIVWAGILIWAGIALLVNNLGLLSTVPVVGDMGGWSLVFTGAGVILIIEVFVRLFLPQYRQPVIGTLIVGLIFMSMGLGDTYGWGLVWPVILIAVGVSIIMGGFLGRK